MYDDMHILTSYHPSDSPRVDPIINRLRECDRFIIRTYTANALEKPVRDNAVPSMPRRNEIVLVFISASYVLNDSLLLGEFAYCASIEWKPCIVIRLDEEDVIRRLNPPLLSVLEMLTAKRQCANIDNIVEVLTHFKIPPAPAPAGYYEPCEKPCEAYEGNEPYIFISYAHSDASRVYGHVKSLYEQGWELWYDEGIKVTERYLISISENLRRCSVVVLFVTNRCLERPFVTDLEIEYAKKLKIPIIPVLLEAIDEDFKFHNLLKSAISPDELFNALSKTRLLNQGRRIATPPVIKQLEYDVRIPPVLPDYEFSVTGETIVLTKYSGTDEHVIVPSTVFAADSVNDYIVTALDGTFSQNCRIKSVVIPPTVTIIGYDCFSSCKLLTHVQIPASVTSIGDFAFCNCGALNDLHLPESITSIGRYAFSTCSRLTSVNIPKGVTVISPHLCSECAALRDISIPDTVVDIGTGAFSDTRWFYEQPEGLVYLCNHLYAHKGEQRDTDFFIKEGTLSVGADAFTTSTIPMPYTVHIPASLISIGCDKSDLEIFSWFTGISSGLAGIEVSPGNPHFSSEDGVLFNKGKTVLLKYPRRKLNNRYTVPAGVKKIESYAFCSCNRLTYIDFPDSLEEVGENAFEYSNTIANILTPLTGKVMHGGSLPVVRDYPRALILCDDMPRISRLLVELYWEGFNFHYEPEHSDCAVRESPCILAFFSHSTAKSENFLKILDSAQREDAEKIVQIFLDGYFENPHNIRTLHHYQAIVQERVSPDEFAGKIRSTLRKHDCALGHARGFNVRKHDRGVAITEFQPTDFVHVIIPKTFFGLPVTSIDSGAFSNCTVESIVIPDCVESIGSSAFYNCRSLKEVKIGRGVTEISSSAFEGCSALTHIDFPDSVQTIGDSAFGACISLKYVKIPDSVIALGAFAFSGCSSLAELVLGDGLKTVGDKLLLDCGALTAVSLGANIGAQGWDDLGLFRHTWRNKGTKNNTWSVVLRDIFVSPNNPRFTSVEGVLYSKDMSEVIFCPPARNAEPPKGLPAPVVYNADNTPFFKATKEERLQAEQAVGRLLQLSIGIEALFLHNKIPYVCGFVDYDEPKGLEIINCFHEYPEWVIGGVYFAGENFLFALSQKVYFADKPERFPDWIMEDSTLSAVSSANNDVIVYLPDSSEGIIAMVLEITRIKGRK